MKEKLLIFPCGGNAKEALDCLNENQEMIGWIDDDPSRLGKFDFGFKIFSRRALKDFPDVKVLAVPGNPKNFKNRLDIIHSLEVPEHRFASVISPRAFVSKSARIGFNTLLMSGVVVTSNAIIGNHVCVLPNSVIHHDVEIGEGVLVGSLVSISGGSRILRNSYIGSGTSIKDGVQVGTNTLLGLGTNLVSSAEENSVYFGNPAKKNI